MQSVCSRTTGKGLLLTAALELAPAGAPAGQARLDFSPQEEDVQRAGHGAPQSRRHTQSAGRAAQHSEAQYTLFVRHEDDGHEHERIESKREGSKDRGFHRRRPLAAEQTSCGGNTALTVYLEIL